MNSYTSNCWLSSSNQSQTPSRECKRRTRFKLRRFSTHKAFSRWASPLSASGKQSCSSTSKTTQTFGQTCSEHSTLKVVSSFPLKKRWKSSLTYSSASASSFSRLRKTRLMSSWTLCSEKWQRASKLSRKRSTSSSLSSYSLASSWFDLAHASLMRFSSVSGRTCLPRSCKCLNSRRITSSKLEPKTLPTCAGLAKRRQRSMT